MLKNALCALSMSHDLVLLLILREVGLEVNEQPKIHCEGPSLEDHSLFI